MNPKIEGVVRLVVVLALAGMSSMVAIGAAIGPAISPASFV